jgi:hypothetical protein
MVRRVARGHAGRKSLRECENSLRRRASAALPAFLSETLFECGDNDRGKAFSSEMGNLGGN